MKRLFLRVSLRVGAEGVTGPGRSGLLPTRKSSNEGIVLSI